MNKHFAKKIKELRKENNLTQDETNYFQKDDEGKLIYQYLTI